PTDFVCEKCGKPMVIKWGKHGSFIACTGYPECTNTRQPQVDGEGGEGVTEQDEAEYCDNCGRPMVLKKGRFGTFMACYRYPECDFVAWGRPIPEKCPECGSSYLIEKFLKAGPVAQCPNAECKFKKPLELPPPGSVLETEPAVVN